MYRGFRAALVGIITSAMALAGLLAATPSAAQDPEIDPIRVYVYAATEEGADTIDPDLPAGEWQVEPFTWGPDGHTYTYSPDRGSDGVEDLAEELGKTSRRRQLIRVAETPQQADVFLQIIATGVEGSISGGGIFPAGAGGAPSSVTTSREEEVMLVRLTIRNQVFTTDFLGTRIDLLRQPANQVAQQFERFIEVNYDGLQQVIYGIR